MAKDKDNIVKVNKAKANKGIIIIIHSFAEGNFIRIRNISRFLDTLVLYAAVKSKIDETKPSIVIEINILDESQRYIVSVIKHYISSSSMKGIRITVKDTDMPTFTDMAKSLGKTLFKTGLNIISGRSVMASEQIQQDRLDTCMNCDAFDHTSYTCTKCGCKLQYKSALKSTTCPLGKWAE